MRQYVIRIEREGTTPRWVQTVSRSDEMGCTVTYHLERARRFAADTAQAHADRLQRLLGRPSFAFVVETVADEATAAA